MPLPPINAFQDPLEAAVAAKAYDELARRDLPTFVESVFGFPTYAHMQQWAEVLMDESIKNLLIVAPPGHAKSSWVSVFYTTWYIGNHPDRHVLLLSNTADQAVKPSIAVRSTVLGNPHFHRLFPTIKPDREKGWGQDRWYVDRPNQHDGHPTMLSSGVPGPILGSRADLLILDDIMDSENSRTDEQRRKLSNWMKETAFSRLNGSKAPRTVQICTRFHEEDFASEFLQDPDWYVIHMPALGYWGKDTALCPEILSLADLQKRKVTYSAGGSTIWEGMYQGNPTVPEGNIIKHAWWKYIPVELLPEHFDIVIQTWDTAFKTGQENDYCVGLEIGKLKGDIFILRMLRKKMDFPELLKVSREFFRTSIHKPRIVLIEDKASGQSLVQQFQVGAKVGDGMLPVLPVKADNDPLARIYAVSGFVEVGRVWVPKGATVDEWVKTFTDEIEGFPTKAKDDITMSWAHGMKYLTQGDQFEPLASGVLVSTGAPAVEKYLNEGWGDLPGHEELSSFLKELS